MSSGESRLNTISCYVNSRFAPLQPLQLINAIDQTFPNANKLTSSLRIHHQWHKATLFTHELASDLCY